MGPEEGSAVEASIGALNEKVRSDLFPWEGTVAKRFLPLPVLAVIYAHQGDHFRRGGQLRRGFRSNSARLKSQEPIIPHFHFEP